MHREPSLSERPRGIRRRKEPVQRTDTGSGRDESPGAAAIAGFADQKKNKRPVSRRPLSQGKPFAGIAVVLMAVSAVLVFSEIWAFTTWAGLKMDEIIFHLNAPLEGTGGGMLEKYVTRCLLPPC